MIGRLSRLVPDRYARLAARYAIPLTALALLLVLGVGVAAASLVTPGGIGLTAARLAETTSLPQTLLSGELSARDADNDGVSDSLENYLYGTDPQDWDSSGTGIPDGWYIQFGHDPLSPLLREKRGKGPDAADLPPAYADGYPVNYTPLLADYYAYGKPAAYRPGVDAPWWRAGDYADPGVVDQARTGVPTGWLLHHGLDVADPRVDRVATGSEGNLTVRQAFEHDTDPLERDSDRDGIDDWIEIHVTLTDPARFSTARTGIADGWLLHFGLNAFDPDVASQDPDMDGLTNREEFLYSLEALRADAERDGIAILFTRGLHPLEWETAGTGIPDGWYVKYDLSPFGEDVDRVIGRASAWEFVRDLESAPEGLAPKPDFEMTIRDAYAYGRPADWNETLHGVWWGGTNPATGDTDDDGMPDVAEIRGWYANVSFDIGPDPKARVYNATSNPLEADSDGDGLGDLEEYLGAATCDGEPRAFPPTDPRNRDTAFSGLTDLEKVCGAVRGTARYDLGALTTGVRLDPTRADSSGDYLRDGAALDFWHARWANLSANPRYPYEGSAYRTLFEWTDTVERFRGMSKTDVVDEFRPDGDVDDDGLPNLLDRDPSGGLYVAMIGDDAPATKEYFLGGPQIDPSLYRFTEFSSDVPHSASDPANPDTDGDGLPDAWETRYGRFDAARGIWNLDPAKLDSDGDGVSDADANNDGDQADWYAFTQRGLSTERVRHEFPLSNRLEFLAGTDPNQESTAGDGISDAWKVFWSTRVSTDTYPSLFAARDAKIGGVALARADEIEAALAANTAIQPLLPMGDAGAKSTGYVRTLSITTACDAAAAALADSLLLDEELPAGFCYAGQDLNGTDVKLARIEGIHHLSYREESRLGTNPFLADTDGDGAPDAYEAYYSRNLGGGITYPSPVVADDARDPDGDGLGIAEECGSRDAQRARCGLHVFTRSGETFGAGADPHAADTDLDGIQDGIEVNAGLAPTDASDVDGFRDPGRDTDRDGVPDFQELTGWGKLEFGVAVRTAPGDPDSDGDGLVDGPTVTLDPANAANAATIEAWRARGIAHTASANGMVSFLGERTYGVSYGFRPDTADSSATGIPDGWLAYYNKNPKEAPVSFEDYAANRPSWWEESRHGVWWWGLAPGATTASDDLDADGLSDTNGEDPFPATLRLNRIVDGARVITDPSEVQAWVEDAANDTVVRERAQRVGDGAGSPAQTRTTARSTVDANGVFTHLDRAKVEVVAFQAPDEVTKGEPFNVTGRVVLNERHADNTLVEGTSAARVGVANRTVLLSAFSAGRERVIGAGFTDANGSFDFAANIGDELRVDIPHRGMTLLGQVAGAVTAEVNPSLLAAGNTTAGERNRLVAWVTNTSATVETGHPTHEVHSAYLTDASGARALRLTNATGFAVSAPRPVSVYSDTTFTTTIAEQVVNGAMLVGDVRLQDASGASIPFKPVVLRWAGVAPAMTFLNLSTDRDGLVNVTNLGIPAAATRADAYALRLAFNSSDPYLRSVEHDFTIDVRDPARLTASLERPTAVVGEEISLSGRLATQALSLAGGATTTSQPIPGATIALRLGSLETTARTGPDGGFTARLAVPASLGAGSQSVTLSFAGSPTSTSAELVLPLDVKRMAAIVDLSRLEGPRSIDVTLRGVLVDNTGAGFAGAIEVYHGGTRVAVGAAKDDGAFALGVPLSALPLGTQQVRVAFPGDATHAPGENFTQARVTSSTRFEILSAPDAIVRGAPVELRARLLDDRGGAVDGQAVRVYWRGEPLDHLVTDSTGAVAYTIPTNLSERPGTTAAALEYVPPSTSSLQPARLEVPVQVAAGTRLDLAPAAVQRGAVFLRGALQDDRETPLAGASVRLSIDGVLVGEARTARNGTFALEHDLSGRALGRATVTAAFAGTSGLAPTSAEATWLVQSPLTLLLDEAGPFVRGEDAPLEGRLVDDRGAPVDLPLKVTLGERDAGTVRTAAGVLNAKVGVPAETARGEHVLTLQWGGDDRYPAYSRSLDVVVKVRPKVEVDLPAVAVRGLSFGGDVTLKDDRGEPMRNTTFVYALGADGKPILGETDADGRARLASVAPISGDAFLALTVRGGGDVVPAEYRTETLRVIGPATPIGYASLVLAIVAAVVIVGLIVVAVVLRRRQLSEVREILEEAIQELLAGNEYAGTIFLAYRRMAALLARHGYLEKESQTPREFAAGVRKALPVGAEPLRELIRLFEEARYSDHPIGSSERDRAVENLARVRNELDLILGKEAKPA